MLRDSLRFLGPLRPLAKRTTERFLFPRYSWLLDRLNWDARLNATVREFPSAAELASPEDLYRHVSRELLEGGRKAIDYLEFGVYEGASLSLWCSLNKNPISRFFGFDSFEGLPEDWRSGKPKGAFSTGGKPPEFADPRVRIVVGWFQRSLPGFIASYRRQNQMVIHVDCDLYSSTLYCLTSLDHLIAPGTLILFDEFYDSIHEYRALTDYCSAYMREYKLIARTEGTAQAATTIL